MKTLSDFPTYTDAKDKLDSLEKALAGLLAEREGIVRRLHPEPDDIEQQAGELLQSGTWVAPSPAGQQLAEIEKAIRVHEQAIELQKANLEQARGQASVEICAGARPAFLAQIEAILKALKSICDANKRLEQLRDELEAQGVQTGSIAHSMFPAIGSWDDRLNMGSAFVYRTWIEQNFPDVKL